MDHFEKRVSLFKSALEDDAEVPKGGYGQWLRTARRQLYSECGFSKDCCKFCDDQRIIDLFYMRFYGKNFSVIDGHFKKKIEDIFALVVICSNLDDEISKIRKGNNNPPPKKGRNSEGESEDDEETEQLSKSSGFEDQFEESDDDFEIIEERNNNPKESKAEAFEKELKQLVEDMNFKVRPFGKEVQRGKTNPAPAKTRIEFNDLELLKELLLSYGPHLSLERRSAKIAKHFGGKFTNVHIKEKIKRMRQEFGGENLIFSKEAAPYKLWDIEEENAIAEYKNFDPELLELLNGQFSPAYIQDKIREKMKMEREERLAKAVKDKEEIEREQRQKDAEREQRLKAMQDQEKAKELEARQRLKAIKELEFRQQMKERRAESDRIAQQLQAKKQRVETEAEKRYKAQKSQEQGRKNQNEAEMRYKIQKAQAKLNEGARNAQAKLNEGTRNVQGAKITPQEFEALKRGSNNLKVYHNKTPVKQSPYSARIFSHTPKKPTPLGKPKETPQKQSPHSARVFSHTPRKPTPGKAKETLQQKQRQNYASPVVEEPTMLESTTMVWV